MALYVNFPVLAIRANRGSLAPLHNPKNRLDRDHNSPADRERIGMGRLQQSMRLRSSSHAIRSSPPDCDEAGGLVTFTDYDSEQAYLRGHPTRQMVTPVDRPAP